MAPFDPIDGKNNLNGARNVVGGGADRLNCIAASGEAELLPRFRRER